MQVPFYGDNSERLNSNLLTRLCKAHALEDDSVVTNAYYTFAKYPLTQFDPSLKNEKEEDSQGGFGIMIGSSFRN